MKATPPDESTTDLRPRRPTPGMVLRQLIPSILVNGALSTTVYFLLRPAVSDDWVALALTGAVPAVWTLGRFAWRRTVDPIGVLAFTGYVLAVAVTLFTDGSPLALELHESALTGALGVVCLASIVVGRPVHGRLVRLLTRRDQAEDTPQRRRMSIMITLLVGGTLVAHAAVLATLAVALPPSTFVALRHLVGLPILGLGVAALIWYRNRVLHDRPSR
ncbi:VC0807 family protein [Amycolatopsis sp. NBC_01286]|uniref:VC0807 family protein n=1 Tax=Amycolatopsis sp. NBC_01286 TaxID=2903560 RepID=UPI002E0EDC3D|nr:hypothetical protein OG570_40485 [Amycolatopsis sp. NBC_01286]